MRLAFAVAVVAALWLVAVPLSAQRSRGGGGGGGGEAGGGSVTFSPFDLLIDELDLKDEKQIAAVRTTLEGAERAAAALFQELIVRRQELLNVETNHATDAAPAAAYTAAVTKLLALETTVFEEIYAQLTPKQKQKAVKGFDRLEELFKATLSAPGSGRRDAGRGRPGGGPGRGMPQGAGQ